MVSQALENNDWVKLSTWESDKKEWTPTLEVLNYHKSTLGIALGNDFKVMLLCGGDLVETFLIPNVWKNEHVCLK